MKYVLGIDQGGSKTQAIVVDETGCILGIGHSAGACHSVTGMKSATESIRIAAAEALDAAGIAMAQIHMLAGGLTGVDWPYEADLLRRAVSDSLGIGQERICIVNDCLIALRAGTAQPYGCILCAGSGLNCAVRHPDGREYVFGYYIEDACQGGAALGRRVLQAVYDAEAGLCGATALTRMVLNHMEFDSVDAMLMKQSCGGLNQTRILHLPRVLETAALEGDAIAQGVLECFGRDIARYVVAGLKRYELLDAEIEVVLSGSIFKCRAPQLAESVRKVISKHAPKAAVAESVYEPLIGAALMALDRLENPAYDIIYGNMACDARRYGMVRKKGGE